MNMASNGKKSRARWTAEPKDLPWEWMGNECAWPPLNKPHEIRVLRNLRWGLATYILGDLELWEITQEVFCDMEVLDLDNPGESQYAALSYTWGDPFPENYKFEVKKEKSESKDDNREEEVREYRIHCNGGSIRTTNNLHAALRSGLIQRFKGSIWIDAVSINQADVVEKAFQVGMMDKIYATAEAVLVWLGPEDESSQTTLKLANTVSDGYKKIPEEIRPRGHFAFNDTALYAMLGVEPISIKDWDAIIRFFSRTWFRRIWMVQEVALSHRLHFVCGEDGIGWIELAGFAKWIHTLGWDVELKHQMLRKGIGSDMLGTELLSLVLDVASSADEGVDGGETRELVRSFFGVQDMEKDGAVILGILALRNQHRDATEPRDKIYGLLGLAKKFRGEYTWEYPAVDYSKSVEQIFQEFGEFLLHHSKSLGMLSLAEPSREDGSPKLPSWIPDFRTTRSSEPLIVHKCHNASRGWDFTPPRIERDPNRLYVEAIKLDTIKAMTGTLAKSVTSTNDLMPIFSLAHSTGETYFTGEPSLEVLFKVLTQNCCTETWEDPTSGTGYRKVDYNSIRESFQNWLKYHISCGSYRLGLGVPALKATPEIGSFLTSSSIFPDSEDIAAYYNRYLEIFEAEPEVPTEEWNRETWNKEILDPILLFEQMSMYSLRMRLMNTTHGFMGMVSRVAEIGDEIWLLRGARVPFVLRKLDSGNYRSVGEVYLHGGMNGEFFMRGAMKVEDAVMVALE